MKTQRPQEQPARVEPRGTLPQIRKTCQPLQAGGAHSAFVEPKLYEATEYEFYVPATVWSHRATRTFLKRLETLTEGATIFKGVGGSWKGETEDVNIYRLIVERDQLHPEEVRPALRGEIATLVTAYAEWAESKQQAVLFTERDIRVSLLSLAALKRVGAK